MSDKPAVPAVFPSPDISGASRADDVEYVLEAIRSNTTVVALSGPDDADTAGMLADVQDQGRDARWQYLSCYIGDCQTAIDVHERIYGAVRSSRLGWRRLPRVGYALEEARRDRVVDDAVEAARDAHGGWTDRLASRVTHLRHCHGPLHCHRTRAARRELRGFPPAGSPRLSDRRLRAQGFERSLPKLLAQDLVAWTRVPHVQRVILLLEGHERYSASLAAARSGDTVLALAAHLRAARASASVVLARATPIADGPGIDNRAIAGVSTTATTAARPLSPTPAQSIVDERLAQHDADDRRLLGLAATARIFGHPLLDALAGGPVTRAWLEREVARGTIERHGASASGEPQWRVEPRLREALFVQLATGRERGLFEASHDRALDHLGDLPIPGAYDEFFELELELAYHEAARDRLVGFQQINRLADEAIRDGYFAGCQKILKAVDDLYAPTPEDEAQALLIRVKLYSDLRSSEVASKILDDVAARHPLNADFDVVAVTAELQRAKLDRLCGRYERALARYREVETEALVAHNMVVVTYCQWQSSLVLGRMHRARQAGEVADSASEGLKDLQRRGASADKEAGLYGIRRVRLKEAHLDRQRAELRRLTGDYAEAHELLSEAHKIYERPGGDSRALAYATVVRSNILRMEGCYELAARRARDALALFEDGSLPDERLHARALRALVLAQVANGEEPLDGAEELAAMPYEVDPAARAAGLLAQAEIYRRRQRWADAAVTYGSALDAAERSLVAGDEAAALIGLLECHRAGAAFEVPSGLPAREPLLRRLLELPCLDELPWLAVRAQLERAYWREEERDEALQAARAATALFKRRPTDRCVDDELVSEFADGLAGRCDVPEIWLVLL